MTTSLTDMTGAELHPGQTVVYAVSSEYAGELTEAKVLKVDYVKKRVQVELEEEKWIYDEAAQSGAWEKVIVKRSQPWNKNKFRIV